MSRSRSYIASSVVAGVTVYAPLSLAESPDGIDLTLTYTPPSITLEWTGGSQPYDVYRSTVASTATDVPHKIADTGVNSYVDNPPTGEIHFYVVTSSHPKLIIRESSFQAMRDRAAMEPWSSMMADAIATSNAGYLPGGDNFEIAQNLIRFSSASALAYVLDEPNARLYATRVRDAILDHVDALTFGSNDWGTVVPPANALFNLTLALDVVYNHLTPAEVDACENKMQQKVNQVWTGDWPSAGLGAIGTWDIFTGARTTPDDGYHSSLMSSLSLDGVFYGGRCYAWARWTGAGRYVKNMYMDVLEFTGVDRRYYSNTRIVGFHEWLYGHSDAVFGGPISFGDCAIEPYRDQAYDEPPLYRAEKFGYRAGQYAATHLPAQISGNLLSYVVPDGPLPPAAYATSKIYPDGGGFFMEAMPSQAARPTAMGGVLWNNMDDEAHSHYEVNAIALAGYNEYLLVNSGYAGWGSGIPGYSWSWIHSDERSGNTLRTASRHGTKAGGGVVEGFTATLFDYASGDDGPALPNDVHLRNLVFVHSDASSNAYFVLFDEVYADSGEHILMNLHPNTFATTGIQTNVNGTEYTATIDAIAVAPNQVKLSVFYATPPSVIRHRNGGIATWEAPGGGFEGKYLESEYIAPASGEKNLLTILFPHDLAHAKAGMTRLSVAGSSGAMIDHGAGVSDHAFESTGAAPVTHDGNTFTGRAVLCRKGSNGSNVFYFVRKGTSFSTTNEPPVGFDSAGEVSVYMRGTQGHIVSPGTSVRFTYPGISGVSLDGLSVSNTASGINWVEVDVPAGTRSVELLTGE
jgi:hypothetical protein